MTANDDLLMFIVTLQQSPRSYWYASKRGFAPKPGEGDPVSDSTKGICRQWSANPAVFWYKGATWFPEIHLSHV
jgi:hypothetical protein